MSFSSEVKIELNALKIKSNCCKKAYLFGTMLFAEEIDGGLSLTLTDDSTVEQVCYFLRTIYKIVPEIKNIKRGCYCASVLTFTSPRISEFLTFADNFTTDTDFSEYLACPNCKTAFLRAAFCARGSVSDPHKSYSLEIQVPNEARAELISRVIEENGLLCPSRTKRNGKIGLFYRNESAIEDLLTSCGASYALFTLFNSQIEKDIRNLENRATNCVAKNILKTVEAISQQIAAIEKLKEFGFYDELSQEIRTTAELRLDNQEATLSELAAMHKPPISKSGLNHRLSKIVDEAKKRKLI